MFKTMQQSWTFWLNNSIRHLVNSLNLWNNSDTGTELMRTLSTLFEAWHPMREPYITCIPEIHQQNNLKSIHWVTSWSKRRNPCYCQLLVKSLYLSFFHKENLVVICITVAQLQLRDSQALQGETVLLLSLPPPSEKWLCPAHKDQIITVGKLNSRITGAHNELCDIVWKMWYFELKTPPLCFF